MVATVPASLCLTLLNEAESLPGFLDQLSKQHLLPAEIVVVDAGSTDDTIAILESWNPPAGMVVRTFVVPGANISAGRNYAIAHAAQEYVLVTDGGTTLEQNWISELYSALQAGAQVAAGFFVPGGSTRFSRILGTVILPHLSEIDPAKFLPSSRSVGFTKAAWAAAGGYPEWLDYCEDLVFDLALSKKNQIKFVPGALAHWDARKSLSAFAKQYYRYARGDGKAGLWRKRHILRYGAYVFGFSALISRRRLMWVIAAGGLGGYLRKFYRRVHLSELNGNDRLAGYLLVPVIVVVGDIAKMVGYPAGLRWRHRQQAGSNNMQVSTTYVSGA